MPTSNVGRWIDELQGAIEKIKLKLEKAVTDLPAFDIANPDDGQILIYDGSDGTWKNYGFTPSGGVSFYDLIDTPITTTGNVTVEDMTGADFLCFGIGVTASGRDQIFEVYLNYTELKRSGVSHFVSGAIGNANGLYSAGAEVAVTDDTTISILALGKSKWSEAAKIFYIRKVTIG